MLKRFILALAMATFAFVGSASAQNATPDEAKAMAEKAAEFLKANGRDVAFKAFDEGTDGFKDRDLYVFVNDYEGNVLAHGANAKLIGKNTRKVKDPNGVLLIEEMIKTASNGGTGWVEYSWPHPETKKLTPKVSYVIGLPEYYVGVGAYK